MIHHISIIWLTTALYLTTNIATAAHRQAPYSKNTPHHASQLRLQPVRQTGPEKIIPTPPRPSSVAQEHHADIEGKQQYGAIKAHDTYDFVRPKPKSVRLPIAFKDYLVQAHALMKKTNTLLQSCAHPILEELIEEFPHDCLAQHARAVHKNIAQAYDDVKKVLPKQGDDYIDTEVLKMLTHQTKLTAALLDGQANLIDKLSIKHRHHYEASPEMLGQLAEVSRKTQDAWEWLLKNLQDLQPS